MGFSQKYCIVQFIEPVTEGFVFDSHNWLPHCTIVGVFALDWNDTLYEDFYKIIASHPAFTTTTRGEAFFGPNQEIHVKLVELNKPLLSLHTSIANFIESGGGVFNEPHYQQAGFRPHITLAENTSFVDGVTIALDTLSLIDMFPGGDHLKRKVLKSIKLG